MNRRHAACAIAAGLVALGFGSRLPRALPSGPGPGLVHASTTVDEAIRVFAHGEVSPDARLRGARTLDSFCPFTPPASRDAWTARRAALRRQIQVALGLWPMPDRTPLNPRVTGVVAREGYRVEKVAIESVPGHYVTGNVYVPLGRTGRLPAVLSPHGHWPGGRFQDVAIDEARAQVASGAEPFETSARFPLQARAVHLARMGVVVFLFDMLGYADSVQLPRSLVHEFKSDRPAMHGRDAWGFFSPQAELHLQSPLGLQIWNAIRAYDYLESRPDVDRSRVGVTGASGGGTQTFLLAAVDDRPAALFPAVMVSTGMQGGCTCENASYLRVGTGNVEIAALAAPKPLGMTAANDWTREMEQKGYPELQRLYALLGARERVHLTAYLQFGHNYNGPSRAAMYEWFNAHLRLGQPSPIRERDFVPLTREELAVWTPDTPAPSDGEEYERGLLRQLKEAADRQLASLRPRTRADLGRFRQVVGGAFEAMVGRGVPAAGSVEFTRKRTTPRDGLEITSGLLESKSTGEAVPAVLLSPLEGGSSDTAVDPARSRRGVTIWLTDAGKAGLFDAGGAPGSEVRELIARGHDVLGIDLLHQGEASAGPTPLRAVPLVSERRHAGYTFGYNAPLPVRRVHDVLAAIRYARTLVWPHERVTLVATSPSVAAVAALARAVSGDAVAKLVVRTGGFRFADVDRIDQPDFLPGAARYGDVPAILALSAPLPLEVSGETPGALAIARDAYAASGARSRLILRER